MKSIVYFDNFDDLSSDLWRAWYWSRMKGCRNSKLERLHAGLSRYREPDGHFKEVIITALLNQ